MKKKILSLTLCAALLGGMSTSVCAAAEDYSEGEIHTIGVAMYDPDSAEMEMFGDYYRDYIEEGFPVKFIFSGKITDAQSECDFIEEAKENGAEGIISFAGFADGLQDVIKTCEKEEMYYALYRISQLQQYVRIGTLAPFIVSINNRYITNKNIGFGNFIKNCSSYIWCTNRFLCISINSYRQTSFKSQFFFPNCLFYTIFNK